MNPKYEALRAAAEKATPGPWRYERDNFRISIQECRKERDTDDDITIAGIWGDQLANEANAEFIVLACNLVPELLDDLRRAEETIAQLKLEKIDDQTGIGIYLHR